MNRNFLIVGLVCASLLLFFYVNSTFKKNENSATPSKSDVSKEIPKIVQRIFSQEGVLTIIEGFWFSESVKDSYDDKSRLTQFYFSRVNNLNLKSGNWLEGIFFSNNDKNPSEQTIGSLELLSFNKDTLVFELKSKNSRQFYDELSLSENIFFKKVELRLRPTPQLKLIFNNDSETVLKVAKISFNNLRPVLKKWVLLVKDDLKITLNLENITNIITDSGTLKYSSKSCSGTVKVKIRPIKDNLYLITPGREFTCSEIYSIKASLDGSNLLQAIGYGEADYNETRELTFK